MKTALIDADIFAYQVAARAETVIDWGEGGISKTSLPLADCTAALARDIEEVATKLGVDQVVICLTHEVEFRKQILPSYKAHRDPSKKPEHLKALKQFLLDNYRCYKRPGLEADDCMGILSTHPRLIEGKKVIVSIDKDMQQIPGWLYNPDKDLKPRRVAERDATYFHFMQTLTGDAADGYRGCPGMGPKRAEAVLFGVSPPWGTWEEAWAAIVRAYADKGLTEEDALLQARVARICRWTDYDYQRKEVKLWQPLTNLSTPNASTPPIRPRGPASR